jgi:lysozyme
MGLALPALYARTWAAIKAGVRGALRSEASARLDVIDVSGYQPVIDWQEVAASGVVGAYVKASEGRTHTASLCYEHTAGARAAGLRVGHYHFARLQGRSGLEPETQAAKFHAASGGWFPGDLPPVLDLEWAGTRLGPGLHVAPDFLVDWTRRFLDSAELAFGVRPIIYTGPSFWAEVAGNSDALAGETLWVVDYRKASALANKPKLPKPWATWALWQYTGSGRTPGVYRKDGVTLADCDRNHFRGGRATLAMFCRDHLREEEQA